MNYRMELWSAALEDLSATCSVDTAMDLETVHRRLAHEGDEFFTITLPLFGKHFERCLEVGGVTESEFAGWKKSRSESPYGDWAEHNFFTGVPLTGPPLFLGGFLDHVFDRKTGLIWDMSITEGFDRSSCIDCIAAVRQLTLMFGKEHAQCSDKRVAKAFDAYVSTEEDISSTLATLSVRPGFPGSVVEPLKSTFRALFADVCSRLDREIHDGDVRPKHGPGSTADRLVGNQKFAQREWTDRLESLFPFGEYAIPNWRYREVIEDVRFLTPEQERPVKVITVPKTASGPRIIAMEPTCMQYMQQAISRRLVELLESYRVETRRNWASSFLGFTHQQPNQWLACIGSEDRSLATLDLSEASDRVPNWLVEALFDDWPWLSEAISVTRSTSAAVPGHGVIPLAKFASMGSALTFPVEAMVFLTVVMTAIAERQNQPASPKLFKELEDKVRVYGDDIIVPTDKAESAVQHLEAIGFKVNRNKSFWRGSFRESCGKEYYAGQDVSIVRVREALPTQLTHVTEVESAVSTRNQFYEAGMWKTAKLYDDVLERVLRGFYPYVRPESSVLGRTSYLFGYSISGWDSALHSPFVRGYVSKSKSPVNPARDEAALLKCLLTSNDINVEPNVDSEHLTRSGRPRAAKLKLVKGRPF